MGRKANPTCVYCAKNYRTEDEAKEKHPSCYVEHNCRVKRYRLRKSSQVNAKRRANYARKSEITTIDPILPESYRAELELYGKEGQFVHAIALKIYLGSELKFQMLPQHVQGLRQPELEDYIVKLLDHLEAEFSVNCFGLVYWLNPDDCFICND